VIDQEQNSAAEPNCDIAAAHSSVRVMVLRAREELVAARHARALLAKDASLRPS
jgi:acetate kinase